jgi:predicted Zn-dependent protease
MAQPPGYVARVDSLYEVIGTRRPVSARLTGMRFGQPPAVTRSAATAPGAPLDVLAAAAKIEEDASRETAPDARWAQGVTHLVAGELDEAIPALEQAAAARPDDARIAVDLSAALITRAERRGDAASAVRGLTAADRALALAPESREARFNRALALESLERRDEAVKAWRDYLTLDSSSPWADEIRQRHLR